MYVIVFSYATMVKTFQTKFIISVVAGYQSVVSGRSRIFNKKGGIKTYGVAEKYSCTKQILNPDPC